MILWTIQTIHAWEKLKSTSILFANHQTVDKFFLDQYQWMANEMGRRIGPGPFKNALPIWAWYQWRDARKKRPDLRSGAFAPRRQTSVLIELEIEEHQVLLSDFELWHYVLNYWYLPSSLSDGDVFEKRLEHEGVSFYKMKPVPDFKAHREIQKSWEQIFDLDWKQKDISKPKQEKSIQACVWELRLENVKCCIKFKAR